jgi:hypothetical protein
MDMTNRVAITTFIIDSLLGPSKKKVITTLNTLVTDNMKLSLEPTPRFRHKGLMYRHSLSMAYNTVQNEVVRANRLHSTLKPRLKNYLSTLRVLEKDKKSMELVINHLLNSRNNHKILKELLSEDVLNTLQSTGYGRYIARLGFEEPDSDFLIEHAATLRLFKEYAVRNVVLI